MAGIFKDLEAFWRMTALYHHKSFAKSPDGVFDASNLQTSKACIGRNIRVNTHHLTLLTGWWGARVRGPRYYTWKFSYVNPMCSWAQNNTARGHRSAKPNTAKCTTGGILPDLGNVSCNIAPLFGLSKAHLSHNDMTNRPVFVVVLEDFCRNDLVTKVNAWEGFTKAWSFLRIFWIWTARRMKNFSQPYLPLWHLRFIKQFWR